MMDKSHIVDARQKKQELARTRKNVVDDYMKVYNVKIDETIKAHNEKIYKGLSDFLRSTTDKLEAVAQKVGEQSADHLGNLTSNIKKEHASQVPTCLVITSSESASSIDTQFSAMIKEIKEKNRSIMVILDEKKCATMKNTIELI